MQAGSGRENLQRPTSVGCAVRLFSGAGDRIRLGGVSIRRVSGRDQRQLQTATSSEKEIGGRRVGNREGMGVANNSRQAQKEKRPRPGRIGDGCGGREREGGQMHWREGGSYKGSSGWVCAGGRGKGKGGQDDTIAARCLSTAC